MPLDCLDLSSEQTAMLDRVIEDGRAWVASDLSPSDWVVTLGPDALDEIGRLVGTMQADPLPVLLRSIDDHDLPALREALGKAKRLLDEGCGFTMIEFLPLDDHDIDDMVACFWMIGQLLGRNVAQKWDGTMLYNVTDTGTPFGYGVRGSYTNVELDFHTDNAFGKAPPDYVGLLCERPAVKGGMSRLCSLYTVHNRMLERHPDLLECLYRPALYDRQAEHAEDAPKTALLPFFAWDGNRITARASVPLIRKGHEVAGIEMDSKLAEALSAVEEISHAEDLWVEAELMRGHVQYLNNREVGHYRSHFEDHPDPARKRHLYRTWHRDRGRRTYDG